MSDTIKKKKSATHFDPYEFEKTIIDGVPVYWKNLPTSPCIHIQVCFGTGSLSDPVEQAGLSHFLEHMIFDGSPTLPNKLAVEEWKKKYTLRSWNAWTFFTNTTYHARCLPEHFETVLAGMRDMIFHPLLRAEDVEHERSVITQETWGRYKNEKYLAYYKEMIENQFASTARGKLPSVLGWPETIAAISQKDVAAWHAQHYGKGNFFIVIVGNITTAHIQKIKSFLKDAPKVKNDKIFFGTIQKPKKTVVRKTGEDIGDPKEQVEISIERTISPKELPGDQIRIMAESLLSDILNERLRTKQPLCYAVSVGSGFQKDFVSSGVSIKADTKNTNLIITEIWKSIESITSGKEKPRFETLKQANIDRLKATEEVSADIVENALYDLWQHGKITTHTASVRARERVTYKNVADYLSKVFKKDWTVTEIISPKKK